MNARTRLVAWLLALVALAGAGWWLMTATEWVSETVDRPLRGEAARDPLYLAKRLSAELGAEVTSHQGLGRLPPAEATLVLTAWHWAVFPERVAQLQAWVEGGGHLVLPAQSLMRTDDLHWVPIQLYSQRARRPDQAASAAQADPGADPRSGSEAEPQADAEADTTGADRPGEPASAAQADRQGDARGGPRGATGGDAQPAKPARERARADGPAAPACRQLGTAQGAPNLVDAPDSWRLCGWPGAALAEPDGAEVLWALGPARAPQLLRVRVGRGQVTVLGPWGVFTHQALLSAQGDQALLLAATLDLRPGRPVWFVDEEARPPLPLWLWQHAAPALALLAAAVVAGLWRAGVRFGPRIADGAPARRSVAEQVRGTAAFIGRHDPAALHAAACRALDAAAHTRLPGWRRALPTERAALLAAATGLDAAALAAALRTDSLRPGAAWPAALALLEQARRGLLHPPDGGAAQGARGPTPSQTTPAPGDAA